MAGFSFLGGTRDSEVWQIMLACDGLNVIDRGSKGAVDWLCYPLNSVLNVFENYQPVVRTVSCACGAKTYRSVFLTICSH